LKIIQRRSIAVFGGRYGAGKNYEQAKQGGPIEFLDFFLGLLYINYAPSQHVY